MITYICYAMFYISEALTAFVFFEKLYARKGNVWVYVMYPLAAVISYAASFFDVHILNLVLFAVVTLTVVLVCYKIKLPTAMFMTAILTVFMLLSELCVLFFSTTFLDKEVFVYKDEISVMIVQASLSKLIYFVIAYSVARIIEKKGKFNGTDKYVFSLAFLPVITVVLLLMLEQSFVSGNAKDYSLMITITAVLLVFANILVFGVYDRVQRINSENTFLQFEQEKNNARLEYYEMLVNQTENRNILIHDIKHHLVSIENLASEGRSDAVVGYINSIRDEFGLSESLHYSGNRMLDVILKRYEKLCKQSGVDFSAEVLNIPSDFLSEMDITALIDNALENALESACKSNKKYVCFSSLLVNDNFIKIGIRNSCDITPVFDKYGVPVSSKKGKNHGWGTKSIQKVVRKYDGEVNYRYITDKGQFECDIVLRYEM